MPTTASWLRFRRHRTLRIPAALVVAIGAVLVAMAQTAGPTAPARSADPSFVTEVRSVFRAAGLDVDDVTVVIHAQPDACDGRRGYFFDGIAHVCAHHEVARVQASWQRRTLEHELAHAWVAANIDAETRRRYVSDRGLAAWHDRDEIWGARATEHAAEAIVWAISPTPIHPDFGLSDRSCAGLAAGYELLTGNAPPHGPRDHCVE